ncbi:PREDICTED: protein IQ-DOMAIN 31-like isoform X2 [Lupinus angustifolius]|uniref:protein IQ-DOMAIN 31-like isoform X2 n=1 Tax=Lupinus angustifolius TaxID=3871 RepID=UPI00092F0BA1|nr:PREDICTED: protein IQ-DOMAIN 31-like isoform X2 [Lupinus angustifolius]
MGKSPGKWIKTLLFRKRSSKSNISQGRELVSQKEGAVPLKLSETDLAADPTLNSNGRNEEDIYLEDKEAENVSPGDLEVNMVQSVQQDAPFDQENIILVEAATKTQAAFRGYLARRAFRALKGIIRLQALIRGHLVRRQTVVTLCSMYAIVKLQALVRGRRVRQCNLLKPLDGKQVKPNDVHTRIMKLSANAFIRKLLASSIVILPLRLQYVAGDPNSVLSWLERWSASYFWKPVTQPKKVLDIKSQRKQGNNSIGEAQMSKSKRTNRKLPTSNFDSVPVQANPELEKPKRNARRISSQPSDPVQESPQVELEKIKRNLRKVHNPVVENNAPSEVESETPKQHSERAATVKSGHAGVLEQGVNGSNEKIKKEGTLIISSVPHREIPPAPFVSKDVSDIPSINQEVVESNPLTDITSKDENISDNDVKNEPKDLLETVCKDENSHLTNGDLSHKEDPTGSENLKPTRKSPIVTKQDRAENGSLNSPTLPSYMAATESAKAKLRAQGSPRLAQEVSERNNPARRHSLPSSINSKISSHSPRTQRPAQAGSKGDHKSDKTVSSSREGNVHLAGKVVQAEWKR